MRLRQQLEDEVYEICTADYPSVGQMPVTMLAHGTLLLHTSDACHPGSLVPM